MTDDDDEILDALVIEDVLIVEEILIVDAAENGDATDELFVEEDLVLTANFSQ